MSIGRLPLSGMATASASTINLSAAACAGTRQVEILAIHIP
jgi:hypothetical protein